MLREKIVAASSRRFIVLGDTTKLVSRLGQEAALPVETVSFGVTPVRRRLEAMGAIVQLRQREGHVFQTDNCNVILDCFFAQGIEDPERLEASIRSIVGAVETGLFLQMTERAIIGGERGLQILSK